MRVIVVLLLVGLMGCSTIPAAYYGKYTYAGEPIDYMAALEDCRVVAEKKADKDNYGESLTAIWWNYAHQYTLTCMKEKGYELIKEK